MAMGAAVFDIIMDRVIVAGEELERGKMRRRHGAARIAKHFARAQVFESSGLGRREVLRIERIVHAGLLGGARPGLYSCTFLPLGCSRGGLRATLPLLDPLGGNGLRASSRRYRWASARAQSSRLRPRWRSA